MTGDLHFFAADLVGYALATAIAVAVLLGPAALLAKGFARLAPEPDWRAFAPALAAAFFPLLDALTIRFGSLTLAVGVRLALLAAAAIWARPFFPRASRLALAGIALWWVYLAAMYLDFDVGGRLYQSITALDMVKHAAVVREIGIGGLPVADPFYARPEAAGYYHYFYDGAAIVDRLGGSLVDARMAFCGAAFACGIAFATFLRAIVAAFGDWTGAERRLTALTITACAIGGFDLIGMALRWKFVGIFERSPEWWDDEISFFATSAAWVPHHLAGVIAAFVALYFLTLAIAADRKTGAVLAGAAGLAMASAFGLSVWVAIGAAAVMALAVCFLAPGDRLKWIAATAVAGIVALIVSLPQISDLSTGRAATGAPMGWWIREPGRIGDLVGTPVNPRIALELALPVLFLEFGALALGTWAFWRSGAPRSTGGRLGRVFVATAVAGILLNLFVRSTIINNDFGWRVAWFAAFPAMVWTITVLRVPVRGGAARFIAATALILGLATTVAAVVLARMPPDRLPHPSLAYINADPATDLALREAYVWANGHLAERELLQHNPASAPRALDFGLYGRNPVMVADYEAGLFGATKQQVRGRAFFFGQIFAGTRPLADAGNVHLVVTDRDPLWSSLDPGLCLYRGPQVCITRKIAP